MDNQLIKQHNFLTTARYEMSALQKNIIYMLLAQFREDDPEEKSYYEIDLGELESRLDEKLPIPELIKAAEGLVFRPYTIRKKEGGFFYSSLISSVENFPERNTLELGVSSMIKPYLIKKQYSSL